METAAAVRRLTKCGMMGRRKFDAGGGKRRELLLRTISGQLKRITGQLKGIYVLFHGHKLRVL
jgi:hypothetical protein